MELGCFGSRLDPHVRSVSSVVIDDALDRSPFRASDATSISLHQLCTSLRELRAAVDYSSTFGCTRCVARRGTICRASGAGAIGRLDERAIPPVCRHISFPFSVAIPADVKIRPPMSAEYMMWVGRDLNVSDTETEFSPITYSIVILASIAAVLSDPVGITLPLVLALLIWWKRGTVSKVDWRSLAPFFAIALAGIAIGCFTSFSSDDQGLTPSLSIPHRIAVAWQAISFYAIDLVRLFPRPFVYPRWHLIGGMVYSLATLCARSPGLPFGQIDKEWGRERQFFPVVSRNAPACTVTDSNRIGSCNLRSRLQRICRVGRWAGIDRLGDLLGLVQEFYAS